MDSTLGGAAYSGNQELEASMTAATIKSHLDWLRSIGQSEYVDDPQKGARRFYLDLLGPYLGRKG